MYLKPRYLLKKAYGFGDARGFHCEQLLRLGLGLATTSDQGCSSEGQRQGSLHSVSISLRGTYWFFAGPLEVVLKLQQALGDGTCSSEIRD